MKRYLSLLFCMHLPVVGMYYVDMTQDRPQNGLPLLTTQYYVVDECPRYPHLKQRRTRRVPSACQKAECPDYACAWPYTQDDAYGLCSHEEDECMCADEGY